MNSNILRIGTRFNGQSIEIVMEVISDAKVITYDISVFSFDGDVTHITTLDNTMTEYCQDVTFDESSYYFSGARNYPDKHFVQNASAPITYLADEEFEIANVYDASNNWGMPTIAHPKNRPPNNEDQFLDSLTGTATFFDVDADSGIVSVTQEMGHTRIFNVTFNGDGAIGMHRGLVKNFKDFHNGVYEIEVTNIKSSGESYIFELIRSEGKEPRLVMMSSNANNANFSVIGMSKYGDHYALAITFGVDACTDSYKITVSSYDGELSQLGAGNGTYSHPDNPNHAHFDATRDYPLNLIETKNDTVENIIFVTQSEYDASSKDAKTLYLIEA